jgi:hypothetical protein
MHKFIFLSLFISTTVAAQLQPTPVFQYKGPKKVIYNEAVSLTINSGPYDVAGYVEGLIVASDCTTDTVVIIAGNTAVTGTGPAATVEAAGMTWILDKDTNAMAFVFPIIYPFITFDLRNVLGGGGPYGGLCKITFQPIPFSSGVVRGPVKEGKHVPGDGYSYSKPYPVLVGGWNGTNAYTLKTDNQGHLITTTMTATDGGVPAVVIEDPCVGETTTNLVYNVGADGGTALIPVKVDMRVMSTTNACIKSGAYPTCSATAGTNGLMLPAMTPEPLPLNWTSTVMADGGGIPDGGTGTHVLMYATGVSASGTVMFTPLTPCR